MNGILSLILIVIIQQYRYVALITDIQQCGQCQYLVLVSSHLWFSKIILTMASQVIFEKKKKQCFNHVNKCRSICEMCLKATITFLTPLGASKLAHLILFVSVTKCGLNFSKIQNFNYVSNKETHFHSRRIGDAILRLNANLLIKRYYLCAQYCQEYSKSQLQLTSNSLHCHLIIFHFNLCVHFLYITKIHSVI